MLEINVPDSKPPVGKTGAYTFAIAAAEPGPLNFITDISTVNFKIIDEFQVNAYANYSQSYPSVTMGDSGNFLIAWRCYGKDRIGIGTFAQRFGREGNMIGGEFQVNTYTHSRQWNPSAAMDNSGNFVISWESNYQDGSGYGIFARLYKVDQ